MHFARLLSTATLAGLLSVGFAAAQEARPLPTDPRDPLLNQGPKEEATGDRVMVSTQLPVVTEGALKVLRDGGNAVDAMVTAVFLQHVNDFHQVSHFGAMSAIYYEAKTGKYHVLSAVSERPRADRSEHGDPNKVAIGGVVRGLEALARRFGTRPWASYLEPAIRSAEEGVLVTSFMYGINYSNWENDDLIKTNKEAREFYMPDGYLVPVGERWKMPALAATLRRVAAEGADYLYTGAWAEKFVREANKKGGRVTMQDMAEYQPKWQDPTRFTYRGQEIIGSPEPDTGGLVVSYNLNILENFDLKALGPYWESPEALEIMARAFSRVGDETRFAIQDPLNFKVPADLWLSKEYGRLGAQFVQQTMPRVNLAGAVETDAAALAPATEPGRMPTGDSGDLGSNHNVIVDAEGNWISMLHTGHGGTPGVFIDGVKSTGSSARALTSGPGRRLVLPITAIMIAKDGKPWLAMGTPGSPPQPVTQVLVNILDYGMHPGAAADAPRFWAARGPDRALEIESRISPTVREGMAARGIKIKDLGPYSWNTGSMQIVWRDPATGRLHGVTDPRRLGFAAGF
jgi:gamma-glutamyltranspeptidase / glutathione hydrolase